MVIFLVGNKMDYIAWLYFLWVTRWIILHGDFLVGNKMDVNVMVTFLWVTRWMSILCYALVGNSHLHDFDWATIMDDHARVSG